MTAVLWEITVFDQFFITRISDLWVNCKSQNGILKFSYVDLKDFWRFEVESKFCQNWKFSWPRSWSEISDFDHLFKTFISDLWVICKFKNGILECSYVDLKDFWEVWGWVKILLKNWKFSWPRSWAKFQILTTFSRL